MKKILLLSFFAALYVTDASAIQDMAGKAVSCVRSTDSENNTTYKVTCQSSQAVCYSTSGSTTTIGCECTDGGVPVSNSFDGGTMTSTDLGDGLIMYQFSGVR